MRALLFREREWENYGYGARRDCKRRDLEAEECTGCRKRKILEMKTRFRNSITTWFIKKDDPNPFRMIFQPQSPRKAQRWKSGG